MKLQKVTDNVRVGAALDRIVLSGDPGCDGYNAEAVVVLEHILRLPADLHLVLGDLVPTGREKWFRQFEAMANANASAPVYCLPGNHDLPEYADYCGRPDYFIHAPNGLFVQLDNARRYFQPESIDFLRETLAAETSEHVFVSFHIPPPNRYVPNHIAREEWGKIRDVLEPHRARIEAIFCAHVHSAFDFKLDDFRVILTGGAGGRLDPVENTCLDTNRHHAFEMTYADGQWAIEVIDIDRDEAAAVYGEEEADKRILEELAEGFSGEAQAYRKYQLFAELAEEEGFGQVAKLFRAAAESEYHHSRNMFIASDKKRTTAENLAHSVARENEEVETLYPASLAVTREHHSFRAANAYDCALHAEKVHHRLFREALKAVRSGEDLKPQTYWTCRRCGFTHAGDRPPLLCPACGTDRYKFDEVA